MSKKKGAVFRRVEVISGNIFTRDPLRRSSAFIEKNARRKKKRK